MERKALLFLTVLKMTGHLKRRRVIITFWVNFFNYDLTSLASADNRELTELRYVF